MEHVHIVGVSPRSGTTLMMELMVACFDFDGWPEHEQSILLAPSENLDRYCSKNPGIDDLRYARIALRRNPDLWIIGMVRDPRDIVVSRHKKRPEMFWSDLGILKSRAALFDAASKHERFIVVRYEDLVSHPDDIQNMLEERVPFLKRTARFSEFTARANPSASAKEALGGVRAISGSSIGRWREELPRLKGQIERYGPIDSLLQQLGYPQEDDWSTILDDVEADHRLGYLESARGNGLNRANIRKKWRNQKIRVRFLLGWPGRKPVLRKAK